jgi:hypothetical protein
MMFDRQVEESVYRPWFAWRPVFLSGPEEWDRMKATGRSARLVWFRWVYRMKSRPGSYYALLDRRR